MKIIFRFPIELNDKNEMMYLFSRWRRKQKRRKIWIGPECSVFKKETTRL